MCVCTPSIRTPFCGKPGCEWPVGNQTPPQFYAGPNESHRPQDAGLCRNCRQRPGVKTWLGTGSAMDYIHGGGAWWCERCCLIAQLAYARDAAARIPDLERQLAEADRNA